jgi:hypothetical protein
MAINALKQVASEPPITVIILQKLSFFVRLIECKHLCLSPMQKGSHGYEPFVTLSMRIEIPQFL